MFLLKETLERFGMTVDLYGPLSRDISAYDAAIHFSVVDGSQSIIQDLKDAGVTLILWPNLWFTTQPEPEHIRSIKTMVANFDAIIFRTQSEALHFSEHLDITDKKVIRCANIISQKFFDKEISDVFRESYGIDKYAIWPGIIEPVKNQISAIRAFSKLNLKLVITGRVRDKDYFELCKKEAGANTVFLPPMQFGSELHLSALKHSSIFIELPLDFPGTSASEALAVGCNMLLSDSAWTREVVGDYCTMVDPLNIQSIKAALMQLNETPYSIQARGNPPDSKAAVQNLVHFLKYGNAIN